MSDIVSLSSQFTFSVQATADGKGVANAFDILGTPQNPANPIVYTTLDLLNDLRTKWRATFLPLLGTAYLVTRYTLRYWDANVLRVPAPPVGSSLTPYLPGYISADYLAGVDPDDAGSATGNEDANFVSLGAIKRTGEAGKKGRGGFHISPVPESQTIGNKPTSGALTAYQDALNTWVGLIVVGGGSNFQWQTAMIHRTAFLQQAVPAGPVNYTKALSAINARSLLSSSLGRKRTK